MDHHEVEISGWRQQWLDRTHDGLDLEMSVVFLILASISAVITGIALYHSIKFSRALSKNPSDRASIFASNDKRMHKTSRSLFLISHIYLYHALAIWLVDASIGVVTIAKDVDSNPGSYDASFWLKLATTSMLMLGIFTSVFIFFPALQMVVMGYTLGRLYRKNTADGTLAAYMTPARVVSSLLAHAWSMTGFLIIMWWPVLDNTTFRVIVLEAVVGSTMSWMHASFLFNYCGDQFAQIEVNRIPGISEGMKLYGKQVYAVYTGKGKAGLPQHEANSETAPLISEKPELQ